MALRHTAALSLALATLLAAGCGPAGSTPAPSSLVPPAELWGVAWTTQRGIVVSYSTPAGPGSKDRLASIDGGRLYDLPLPDLPGCARVKANAPFALPDGRVGFLAFCGDGLVPTGSVVGILPDAGGPEVIAQTAPRVLTAGQAAALPGGAFLVGYGGAFCSTIIRVDASGSALLPWTVGEPPRQFRLDVEPSGQGDCPGTGWADEPTVSPDGGTVAFAASTDAIGKSGQARLDAPRGIYLADPATGQSLLLASGVRDPRGLAFSHDGTRLAFAGQLGDGREGTWVLAVATRALSRAAADQFDWLAWSPDDALIAGLVEAPSEDDPLLSALVTVAAPAR